MLIIVRAISLIDVRPCISQSVLNCDSGLDELKLKPSKRTKGKWFLSLGMKKMACFNGGHVSLKEPSYS